MLAMSTLTPNKGLPSIKLSHDQINELWTNKQRVLIQHGEWFLDEDENDVFIWEIPCFSYCKLGKNNSLVICDNNGNAMACAYEIYDTNWDAYVRYEGSEHLVRIVAIMNNS